MSDGGQWRGIRLLMYLSIGMVLMFAIVLVTTGGIQTQLEEKNTETQQTAYRYADILQDSSEGYLQSNLASQLSGSNPNGAQNIPETAKTALCPSGASSSCPFYGTVQLTNIVDSQYEIGQGRTSGNATTTFNNNVGEDWLDATEITRVYASDETTLLASKSRQVIIRYYNMAPYVTIAAVSDTSQGIATTGFNSGTKSFSGTNAGAGSTMIEDYTECYVQPQAVPRLHIAGVSAAQHAYEASWCLANYGSGTQSTTDAQNDWQYMSDGSSIITDENAMSQKSYPDSNLSAPAWTP